MSFADIFKKSFLEGYASGQIDIAEIVICMLITVLIGMYIFMVYRIITRNSFYNRNFNLSFIEAVNVYALSPLLWICVGILVGSFFGFGQKIAVVCRSIMVIIAFAPVLVYLAAAVFLLSKHSSGWVSPFVYWCTLHSTVFAVPGFLCGLTARR